MHKISNQKISCLVCLICQKGIFPLFLLLSSKLTSDRELIWKCQAWHLSLFVAYIHVRRVLYKSDDNPWQKKKSDKSNLYELCLIENIKITSMEDVSTRVQSCPRCVHSPMHSQKTLHASLLMGKTMVLFCGCVRE